MADFVPRCVGCGRTVGDAVPPGARPGLPVDWAYDLADGRTRDVHDFCCGDCLRQTVTRASHGYAERHGCPRCDVGCDRCEGGLVFRRPDVAKELGVTHPATHPAAAAPSGNPNTNCLEGMRCPKCGSYGPLEIAVLVTARVSDGGSDVPAQDHEWHDDSPAKCAEPDCEFTGTVLNFREEGRG